MGFWAVVRREWQRMRQDWRYGALLTVAPLGAALLLSGILGRGVVRDLPIALCDEDHSPLSRRLAQMVDASEVAKISAYTTSPEEGQRVLRASQVWGLLYIPRGFEEGVRSGQGADLVWWASGCNLSANGLLTKQVQACTMALGEEIERSGEVPISKTTAEPFSMQMATHLLFNPTTNYGHYLLPGFLGVMLLLFVLLSTLYAIGEELYSASAREWYTVAGGSLRVALAGKLLPVALIHLLVAQLYLLLLVWGVGIPFRGSIWLLEAATLLLIFDYQAIGITLSALGNMRLALSLGGGYGVMAFTFSGLTFPLMAFYAWLRPIAWLFPFTPYLNVLINQMVRGAHWSLSVGMLAPMLLFLLLPLPFAGRLQRLVKGEGLPIVE